MYRIFVNVILKQKIVSNLFSKLNVSKVHLLQLLSNFTWR